MIAIDEPGPTGRAGREGWRTMSSTPWKAVSSGRGRDVTPTPVTNGTAPPPGQGE